MGRALFSTYPVHPVIRTEPEPQPDVCERWSSVNSFDPDSDDFFQNAQYEAFIDHALHPLPPLRTSESTSESSEAGEPSVTDQSSPMAIGFDDPAILLSDAYGAATRRNRAWPDDVPPTTATYTLSTSNTMPVVVSPTPTSPIDASPPPFIPPVMFREPSPAPAPVAPRPSLINAPPVSVFPPEAFSRSPSPRTPSPPSTPPMQSSYPQIQMYSQSMLTPSPAPSVTPRFYSWYDRTSNGPSESPTRGPQTHRETPVTLSRTRMSFARVETSPAVLTAHGR